MSASVGFFSCTSTGSQADYGYVGKMISNHLTSRITTLQRLLGLEQVRLLGLILGLAEGTGVSCFLKVNELLAESGAGALSVAISDGDAAVEQEQRWNQEECGESGCEYFHIEWRCRRIDVCVSKFI